MTDKFEMSDFDAPVTAPDHTVLLDAITKAAAAGVHSANARLVASASEVERQVKEMQVAERSLHSAMTSIHAARSALFWDNAKHLLLYAAVAGLVMAGAGFGWHFVFKPAKVVQVDRYCTSWNAKKGVCNVDWKLPIR